MQVAHRHKTNAYFPKPLDLRETGGGKWQVLSDFIYNDDVYGEIIVPAGLITDFYSIPRPLRGIVNKIQESNAPAVVHDWLYRCQGLGEHGQREADNVLNRAMETHWSPVSWWQRKKIITGLRIGGWIGYRENRKNYQNLEKLLGRKLTANDIVRNLIP